MDKSVTTNNIEICKIADVSKYLSLIDCTDVDAEFYKDVSKNFEDIYVICYDDKIIGLSSICDDSEGFLYVYIFPEYRNKGYGYIAACASEQRMCSSPLLNITTTYGKNNEIAKKFAEKCGFVVKEFSSACMKYQGEMYENLILPIRKYEDEDYFDAHTLSAEAFHKMRLETGYFPDSIPDTPDDEARQYSSDTADERYVYVLDNEIVGHARIEGAELSSVSIKISHQGKGLGKGFVKFLVNLILEKGIGEPFLYCVVGNNARQLYDSLGFKETNCNEYAKKNFIN